MIAWSGECINSDAPPDVFFQAHLALIYHVHYVQAILRGLKPCIIGIILATGVYMILRNCFLRPTVDWTALIMTVVLAAVYFGSWKISKKGISPIGLIGISAVAGIAVYGIKG